jgi:hypothetical protein
MTKMLQNIGLPAILICIGLILAAVGGLLAALQKTTSENALQKKNVGLTTGGDSFAYLMPFFIGSDNTFQLTIIHHGDYPLYDMSARIVDLEKFEKITEYTLNEIKKTEQALKIGNLAPNKSSMLGTFTIKGTQLKWNIFFSARNGFFSEHLRIVKINGTWKSAIRVDNTPTKEALKILFEKVDKDFPVNDNGDVEW